MIRSKTSFIKNILHFTCKNEIGLDRAEYWDCEQPRTLQGSQENIIQGVIHEPRGHGKGLAISHKSMAILQDYKVFI